MPAPTLLWEGSSTPGIRSVTPKKRCCPAGHPAAPGGAALLLNQPLHHNPSLSALQTNKPSPRQGKPSTAHSRTPVTLTAATREGLRCQQGQGRAPQPPRPGLAGRAGRGRRVWCVLRGSAPCPGVPPRISRQGGGCPCPRTGCPTCTPAQAPDGSAPPCSPPVTWNWRSNNLAGASAASLYPRT